jgi:ferredoxin
MPACIAAPVPTSATISWATADPNNMPVARQDLMRKVYRRYFTLPGKIAPWLVGAEDLTKDTLNQWYTYYHQCSECRRCSVYCPYGIDTAEVTMAGREILNYVGMGQKYSNEILVKVQKIGNNLGLPGPALEDTLLGLEEDIEADTGVAGQNAARCRGRGNHAGHALRRLLLGAARRVADRLCQGVPRRGGFLDAVQQKPRKPAISVCSTAVTKPCRRSRCAFATPHWNSACKRIIVGECGHAWRVAYSFWNTLTGVGYGGNDPFSKNCKISSITAIRSRCTSANTPGI